MRFNSRTKDYLLWPQILISPIKNMSEFLFKCPKMKSRRLSSLKNSVLSNCYEESCVILSLVNGMVSLQVLFLILPVILSVPIQTFMKDQKEADTSNNPHIVEFCPLNEWYWEFVALSKCGNTSYYHCLATNEGRFVEFCNESSTWIEKGNPFNYIVSNTI